MLKLLNAEVYPGALAEVEVDHPFADLETWQVHRYDAYIEFWIPICLLCLTCNPWTSVIHLPKFQNVTWVA